MDLVDFQIRNLCSQVERPMVSPFDPELLNPASLDVRLGDTMLIESAESPEMVPYPFKRHSQENPYKLAAGQFVLTPTMEMFDIPKGLAAEFKLKSSRAREGLDHALAAWCDPGWHGSVLTLELRNIRQLWSVPIWPGMRIGQIIFRSLSAQPLRCYAETGRYNGDAEVMGSKG